MAAYFASCLVFSGCVGVFFSVADCLGCGPTVGAVIFVYAFVVTIATTVLPFSVGRYLAYSFGLEYFMTAAVVGGLSGFTGGYALLMALSPNAHPGLAVLVFVVIGGALGMLSFWLENRFHWFAPR